MSEAPHRKKAPESARLGRWVRLYTSILDNPRLAAIPDDALRTWLYIQTVAGREDGDVPGSCARLPDLKALAWMLRMSGKESRLAKHLDILLDVGLLEHSGNGLLPRDWSKLQRASDNPTTRKREQRDRDRKEQEERDREEAKKHSGNEQCHVTGPHFSDDVSRDSPVPGHDPPPETVTVSLSREDSEIEIDRESSSSTGTKPHARERSQDDDDHLLQDLRKAANGKIAPSCVNVGPIRRLIAQGLDREKDVLAVFREAVTKLHEPLKTFGAPWIVEEITAWAEARRSASHRESSSSPTPEKRTFITPDDSRWAAAAARYREENGRLLGPPVAATGPSGRGAKGWYFSADWPECAPIAAPREAAE
jgi:hypothetical protein